jgi:CDP-diacylglycerol--serine O-phosphatidyltransferase
MKKHIPNILTLCNALCGCIGISLIAKGEIQVACYLVFIALVFDYLDGFVARLLRVKSEIGKQLDSLADAVTFGVLPAFIAQSLWVKNPEMNGIITYFPFILALFSILRLAKFNIDTRQTDSFIGVPTPANAMIWASFPLILSYQSTELAKSILENVWFLGGLIVVMSYLLVAELPLFALKFKDFSWKNNQFKYIFLILSIALIAIFQFGAIPAIIATYVLSSVFLNLKSTKS